MSVSPVGRGGNGQRWLADGMAAMRAVTTARDWRWVAGCYAFGLAMGVAGELLSWRADKPGPDWMTLCVLGSNFALWATGLARLVLVEKRSFELRLPGVTRAVRRATALGFCIAVLVPAALLAGFGASPALALLVPALAALAGLLFALLPISVSLGLFMLAVVLTPLYPAIPGTAGPALAAALCASPLIALKMYWGSVVRTAHPAAIPPWRRSPLLRASGPTSVRSAMVDVQTRQPPAHGGWLIPARRPAAAGPHHPQLAIGALIGGPMGQIPARAALRQWSLIGLTMMLVLMYPIRIGTLPLQPLVVGLVLVGTLSAGWTLAFRLDRQQRWLSRQLPELALLPGLGDAGTARTRLLGSVLGRLRQLMLVAGAVLLVFAWRFHLDALQVALLAAMMVGITAGSVLMCLLALCGLELRSLRTLFAMLPLLVAATSTMVVVLIRLPVHDDLLSWALAWTALTSAYAAASWLVWRRFQTRPHAFLTS